MPPKVFFINDSSANPNWGCRATSHTLENLIEHEGGIISARLPLEELAHPNWKTSRKKQALQTRIETLTKSSSFSSKASSALMNRWVRYLPDVAPKNWAEFSLKVKDVLDGGALPHVKEAFQACDILVINGEGGILQNQRESRMMFFLAYLAKTVFQKKVALVSHTASLEDPVLLEIAQHVYPLVDDVVFRDLISFEKHGELSQGRFASDVTFAYKPAPKDAWLALANRQGYYDHAETKSLSFDAEKPFICLGGSSMFSPRHRLNYKPKEALYLLAERLSKLAQVVIVASAKPDETLLKPIAQDLKLPFIPLATAPLQAVDLLGNSSLYVGGRWHGAIFALTGGTPVVSFEAETFKLKALMQQFSLNEPFSALNLENHIDDIVSLSESYLEDSSLRSSLLTKAEQASQTITEHVKIIKDFNP